MTMATLRHLGWLCLLLLVCPAAADYNPKITLTNFPQVGTAMSYFDDSRSILALRDGRLFYSKDDGAHWDYAVSDEHIFADLKFDPFNRKRAFALSQGQKHYLTEDQGKTWKSFEVQSDKDFKNSYPPVVSFNAAEEDYLLLTYTTCKEGFFNSHCHDDIFYTKNGFRSKVERLNTDAQACDFARSTKLFKGAQKETIYCIQNKHNSFEHVLDSKLVISDDFFASSRGLKDRLTSSGRIIEVRAVQDFLMAIVQNDKFNKNSRITIFVSKDGDNFDAADLQVEVADGMIEFLDSSPSSVFLAISGMPGNHDGLFMPVYSTIYSTDSSGLRFKKVIDKVEIGAIKKVQTVDGVWIANVLDEKTGDADHQPNLIVGGGFGGVVSKMSLDDGKTWDPLRIVDDSNCDYDKGCSLHVFTPSTRDGEGDFVTGPTPGILMAVGSAGDHLTPDIKKMKTYLSRDSGVTWTAVLDQPCLFAFGDHGNIITAVPYYGTDDMSTNELHFSLDQGKTWSTMKLETAVFPLFLTTTIDSTTMKFLFSGMIDRTPENKNDFEFDEALYAIDFAEAFGGKKCSDDQFEEVYARVPYNEKTALCVYGHREKFNRRKQDAKCLMSHIFDDVKIVEEPCECTTADFECAAGFKATDDGECTEDKESIVDLCEGNRRKELSLPDKVKVDGNKCELGKKSLKDFVATHKIKCSDYVDKHKGTFWKELISSKKFEFDGHMQQYSYIEQGTNYNGENVVVLTKDGRIFGSRTGGLEFVKVPVGEEFITYYTGIVPGQVILVSSKALYFSTDSGNSYKIIKTPETSPINFSGRLLSFHKTDPLKYIYYAVDCRSGGVDCKVTAHLTVDGGSTFSKLRSDVKFCDFISPYLEEYDPKADDLIYCQVFDGQKVNLVSSSDQFKNEEVLLKDIVGHAITGYFVVVATIDTKTNLLNAKVTVDGTTFADAAFPADFKVDSKVAYTVLDSETQAIFLHVTTSENSHHEYGAILKSNSNGTSYVLSLNYVNRNGEGYVDYDRIEGLEGKIIANTVFNPNSKDAKQLKTQMTHNDGGEWGYIEPPKKDSEGNRYQCTGKSLTECSLNLHGFTERIDYRDTFSSPSATGLIMAIGNVGKTLGEKDKGDTFLSKDGGLTWMEIKKGPYMWEFGDRGTILVMIDYLKPTNKLLYSLDEGTSWHEYEFSDKEVDVEDLATVPSDNSRKFLIFAKTGKSTTAYAVDFTNIQRRQCTLDLDNPDSDDFDYWSPTSPLLTDTCLFGHEAKYLRRNKHITDCFIGSAPLIDGFKISRNCSCTRKDFECDFNYYRDNDDTCKLIRGLSPADHKKEMCKNDAFQYFQPTGYRKIPISTCEGGKRFDSFQPKACPGKSSEFNKFYGQDVGFGKLLFIIAIPLGIFFFATWFVYDRGIRRNGGFKRFGQIRLDGDGDGDFQPVENNEVDKVVNLIVRGGVTTVATVIAVFKTVISIDKMMLEKVTGRIFGRRPGRRNYVNVPEIDAEEEELFGNFRDNYDEELEEGGAAQSFTDNVTDGSFNEEEARNIDADSRLFDIDDDQFDEDNRPL